ncbi:MAG: malectin domain-containing carbohydrate-binding protein [Actinomycetota bacterium]
MGGSRVWTGLLACVGAIAMVAAALAWSPVQADAAVTGGHVVVVDGGAVGSPYPSTQALIDVVSSIDGGAWTVEHRNRSTGSTDMSGVDVLWVPDQFGTSDLHRWVGLDVGTLWSHEQINGFGGAVVEEDYATHWYNEYTPYDMTYALSGGHPITDDLGWVTTLDPVGYALSGERTLMTQTNWHFSYLRSALGPGAELVLLFYPDASYVESNAFVAAASYESGAAMANGTVAQDRRVLWGMSQWSHGLLAPDTEAFLGASFRWLAGTGGSGGPTTTTTTTTTTTPTTTTTTTTPTTTTTTTPTTTTTTTTIPSGGEQLVVALNVGGGDHTTAAGVTYDAAVIGYPFEEQVAISGTDEDPLYRSEGWSPGTLDWTRVVPNGTYRVDLHFAEVWSGAFSPGVRVFDVVLEGAVRADDVDVFAEVGANAAYTISRQVSVTDGQLDLELVGVSQNPKLNALAVWRLDP